MGKSPHGPEINRLLNELLVGVDDYRREHAELKVVGRLPTVMLSWPGTQPDTTAMLADGGYRYGPIRDKWRTLMINTLGIGATQFRFVHGGNISRVTHSLSVADQDSMARVARRTGGLLLPEGMLRAGLTDYNRVVEELHYGRENEALITVALIPSDAGTNGEYPESQF